MSEILDMCDYHQRRQENDFLAMLNGLSRPFKKILMLFSDLGFFFKGGGLKFCVNSLNFHLCFRYSRLRPENENI